MPKPRASKSNNAKGTTAGGKQSAKANITRVRVRMYRQGLGDCFLLSFASDDSFDQAAHVLIDCGTLGTSDGVNMKAVADDIATTTQSKTAPSGELALLVATHEHQDHLSGFNSEQAKFKAMQIDHVWLAWTENSNDPLAKKLAKYKGDLGLAALAASKALSKAGSSDSRSKAMAECMEKVLSFNGAPPAMGATFAAGVDAAMKFVASRASGEDRQYLMPGKYVRPSWLPGVTVFVLGPPHDEAKIKNMGEHGDPELYELSESTVSTFGASAKWFAHDASYTEYAKSLAPEDRDLLDRSRPFDQRYRIDMVETDPRLSSYFNPAEQWRRVDTDWLFSSADLALQLDNLTNNTSLALAFEIGEDGPVILMAADAQLGNWLSWHDYTWEIPTSNGRVRTLKAADLLSRTIVYKVGHHSSHNATAVKHGLEMMTSSSLVALIPLDKEVAEHKQWPMPAEKLYERLVEKAKGRVLRSDIGWPTDAARPDSVPESDWKKLPSGMQVSVEKQYVDVSLSV